MAAVKPHYSNIFWISLLHVASIVAIPFFSWSALALCLVLLFVISPLGITLTYHRLLAHRAFRVPVWLEYTLATLGALSAQGSPIVWVGGHRLHHRFSDAPKDPHNSRRGFFYAHVGHLLTRKEHEETEEYWFKTVPDLSGQRYYRFLHKYSLYIALSILPTAPGTTGGSLSWRQEKAGITTTTRSRLAPRMGACGGSMILLTRSFAC